MTKLVEWEDRVVGWLMEHYKDALAASAPLGFIPSHNPLEMLVGVRFDGADHKYADLVVKVIPSMPGCRAKYWLKYPYLFNDNHYHHEDKYYDRLDDLMKDIIPMLDD